MIIGNIRKELEAIIWVCSELAVYCSIMTYNAALQCYTMLLYLCQINITVLLMSY